MKIRYALATIITLSFSSLSQAAFVPTDVYAINDQKATLDSETGLEWLDLTETFDITYNTVVSELDTTYAGWRLPSAQEVMHMMGRYLSEKYSTTVPTTLGTNVKIASGAYNDYSSTGASNVLNRFNQAKHNFGGSLCSNTTSTCSTYSSQANSSTGYVAGIVYNENYIQDGTAEYGKYGLYLARSTTNPSSKTSASTQAGASSINPDSAWYTTGKKYGTWLVSDGGTTLSSIQDPSLNSNNANAPVNEVPAGGLSLLTLAAFGLLLRRKAK
jgi:hypothetical protein